MPHFKSTMRFTLAGTCESWSHAFYQEAASHDPAMQNLQKLSDAYMKTQSENVHLTSLTVSQTGKRGDVFPSKLLSTPGAIQLGPSPGDEGLLVTFPVSGGDTAKMILKTMVDDYVDRQERGRYRLDTDGQKVWLEFLPQIAELGFLFRVNKKPPEVDTTAINDVTFNKEAGSYTITGAGPAPDVGTRIFVFGATSRSWKGISGERRVAGVNGNVITIISPIACDQSTYEGGLSYYVREYDFRKPVGNPGFAIGKVTSRKAGRPFGLHRGRSQAKPVVCK